MLAAQEVDHNFHISADSMEVAEVTGVVCGLRCHPPHVRKFKNVKQTVKVYQQLDSPRS